MIPPQEIHLWLAELDLDAEGLAHYRTWLSADERARADRLLREEDRGRFVAGRGILRSLLGSYLERPPRDLRFAYATHGRPFLLDPTPQGQLGFSLAHSQGRALYAFAWNRDLGVDLERRREPIDASGIAGRYFSEQESARLAALPEAERSREFFRLWTAKEAYAKALGEGLRAIGKEPEADPRFQVESLELGAEDAAALAYSGGKARLAFFQIRAEAD